MRDDCTLPKSYSPAFLLPSLLLSEKVRVYTPPSLSVSATTGTGRLVGWVLVSYPCAPKTQKHRGIIIIIFHMLMPFLLLPRTGAKLLCPWQHARWRLAHFKRGTDDNKEKHSQVRHAIVAIARGHRLDATAPGCCALLLLIFSVASLSWIPRANTWTHTHRQTERQTQTESCLLPSVVRHWPCPRLLNFFQKGSDHSPKSRPSPTFSPRSCRLSISRRPTRSPIPLLPRPSARARP